jgi:hypothetical protein
MRHFALVLFCLCICHFSPYGQSYYVPKKIVASSPEASALEKFVDYPVSQFTGTPNISVPFYTIELSSFSLPIMASYHASGNSLRKQIDVFQERYLGSFVVIVIPGSARGGVGRGVYSDSLRFSREKFGYYLLKSSFSGESNANEVLCSW